MMDQAKLEKVQELKRLLREIIANKGEDSEMDEDQVQDMLDEASEDAEAPEVSDEGGSVSIADESEDEDLDSLTAMKRAYFKPKAKERRPGTAIVIAKQETTGPSLKDAIPSPKKKSRYV